MATPDLTSDAFWRDRGVHVALPPDLTAPPTGLIELAQPHLPEGGCLFRTSGTTGEPKWVALEKRALLHSARVVNAHYNLTQSDTWLCALPLHHIGGFSIFARAWLSKSKVLFSLEKWNVENFVEQLNRNDIGVTSIVPTQLHDLVEAVAHAPPSLRVVVVGGGRIDPTLLREARRLGWPVCATYGMTETASQVASQALDHDLETNPEALEVLPHWEARTDETGTLLLRGPALAKGYIIVTQGELVWQPIDPELGLLTRDRVELHHDGTRSFLRFLGRNHSFLKILGELVPLEALEQRFRGLCPAGFPTVALLALPDPRREHRLVLVLESATPPMGLPALLDRFHQLSAPFERLSQTLCLPAFPRTDLGKVAQAKLQQWVMETVADQPSFQSPR